MVREKLNEEFSCEISQVPPMYSAIKIKGQRLYKLARKGKTVERAPRSVIIHNTEITDIQLPYIQLEISCSKGTYIRSIAHDLGLALESRAHLTELKRTRIGYFSVENALSIDDIQP